METPCLEVNLSSHKTWVRVDWEGKEVGFGGRIGNAGRESELGLVGTHQLRRCAKHLQHSRRIQFFLQRAILPEQLLQLFRPGIKTERLGLALVGEQRLRFVLARPLPREESAGLLQAAEDAGGVQQRIG